MSGFSGFHVRGQAPPAHNRWSGHESNDWGCDGRSLFGIHLAEAKTLAVSQSPRGCVLPPHREHLAPAFARFFQHVGLPVDVPPLPERPPKVDRDPRPLAEAVSFDQALIPLGDWERL